MLATCQRMLPIVFNRFNRAQSWLEKFLNQTNRKRFFAHRTRKNPTNLTNQKTVDPNRTRPKTYAVEGYHNVGMTRVLSYQHFSVLTLVSNGNGNVSPSVLHSNEISRLQNVSPYVSLKVPSVRSHDFVYTLIVSHNSLVFCYLLFFH